MRKELAMDLRRLAVNVKDVFFYKVLELNLSDCNSVLDVGCGDNSPLRKVKKTFYSEGIDIYRASIIKSKKNKIHDKYIIGNIENIDKYYKNKSFDAVISMDVIEHFEKNDALKLLKKMEKVARKKLIILTPNGFLDQGHYEDNPYQDHKSGWLVKDLRTLGYTTYGLRSFKFLRGAFASIRFRPWLFWGFIAFITEPILYYFPKFSFHIFAIKILPK